MAEISLFNKYHGSENTITNYCGLMLKFLYQLSPKKFENCISNLIESDKKSISVGPIFQQQIDISKKGQKKSIADLTIFQSQFKIVFEVKEYDWFYSDQFKRYCISLKKNENVVIFALTKEYYDESKFEDIKSINETEKILIQPLTFEKLLSELQLNKPNDESFEIYLNEFEEFLNIENLLPSWKYLLDVVNCASSIEDVRNTNCYYCPDTSGPYKHRRAKYFAPYNNKSIFEIYEILGVAIISGINPLNYRVKFRNSPMKIDEFENRIEQFFEETKEDFTNFETNIQLFILSDHEKTNFVKKSPGGLFGSKKYFPNIAKNFNSLRELANYLNGKSWEEFI